MRLAALMFVLAACGGSTPPPTTPTSPSEPTAVVPPAAGKVLVNVDAEGVAVTGYDVISYMTGSKLEPGDQEYGAKHGGAIFWFASPERKATFEATPAKYAPQYGGYCAYAASQGRLSEVQAEVYEVIDGQLLLFTNPEFKRLYKQDPTGNKKKADEQWPALVEKFGK